MGIGLVLDNFGMTSEEGMSSLAAQVINVIDRACEMAKWALRLGMQRSFTTVHSHYKNIDLQAISQGFAPGYDDVELDQIEEKVAPIAQVLAVSMEEEVVFKK
jgi:hypothetical protein